MTSASAFEILRRTQQLPVVEKELVFGKRSTNAAAARSTAGAAWGKSSRKWVAASSSSSAREFGDAMPRELRILVAASFDVFIRTQQDTQMGAFGVARASREYREALKTCIFTLEDRLETHKDADVNAEEEGEFLDLLKVSLAIWHLCELLFLRGGVRGADRTLAYDLALWLQEHYCSTLLDKTESESERLKKQQKPEVDAAFWHTIQALVMTGDGSSAWSLLATHSTYKSLFSREAMSLTGASTKSTFQAVQKLLLTMPGRAAGSDMNMEQDGATEWKNWNDACQYLLNTDGYIKSNAGFTALLEVMAAKEESMKSHASTWYELMMARLFLDEPKTVAHRFEFLMANCFRVYHNESEKMDNFECIILAIMQYDIQNAIQDIIALGFSWMAAHLADLLQKNNVILADELLPEGDCTLRERFLLEYAMEIGASSSMWQFVVRYYEHCPKFGVLAIRSALAREPLPTDNKTERLLAYCQGKKILAQSQKQITIQRAQECKTKKAYASALQWMLRGGHLDDMDALCDDILKECNDANSLTALHEAVQFMDGQPEFSRSQKLAWLVKYREFQLVLDDLESLRQQLKTDESLSNTEKQGAIENKLRFVSLEAAKRLDWLFSSTEAPKRLCFELLQQAERLLKESPTVFGSRHLYTLMAFLQQLDRSFNREQFYESGSNKQLKERIESLISRNLAEAMLQEASASGCAVVDPPRHQTTAALIAQQQYLIADASFTPMEE
ncbi:Nuclear pore complex protein Nup85 [Phytophthora citrophthora]|uniref:Nuclear pore complex protein Nup85 n=1 Tax=Phytophthora citrophthora TaxID=4793 RepID=A0AAD9LRB3_9STRA|nr:Nuclear pore complex protein Nup85 [Phytophthora citrophthora]